MKDMETELIKLKVRKKSAKGEDAQTIKETFIKACENLDASIFEPLIEEEQYFQDIDKYRFLQSLKDEFDKVKRKNIQRTTLIKGTCDGCHCEDETHQFYGGTIFPEFSYIIHEEKGEVIDIFLCNLSDGRNTVDWNILSEYGFWRKKLGIPTEKFTSVHKSPKL